MAKSGECDEVPAAAQSEGSKKRRRRGGGTEGHPAKCEHRRAERELDFSVPNRHGGHCNQQQMVNLLSLPLPWSIDSEAVCDGGRDYDPFEVLQEDGRS